MECGYKLGADRRQIRRVPELEELHKWLIKHTDNGNITRQEAVSMIPPLALDVQPHHKCLDMCAAPGSKTSQILEIINRSADKPVDQQGVVVANDSDTSRAYMLVHQCRRTFSSQLLITTHKGQQFPALWNENINTFNGYFDRVLCDVPCSGDGTLRKNPMIWGKWAIYSGLSLHPLQLLIAKRGIQLLKVGGIMVYSTCSMNPYENEAVVAELLRSGNGSLELVDVREFIPLFKSRAGLSSWYVLDDSELINKKRLARYDEKKQAKRQRLESASDTKETTDVEVNQDDSIIESEKLIKESISPIDLSHIEDPYLRDCIESGITYYPDFSTVPPSRISKVRKSVFPPSIHEAAIWHLERCMRCVPHDEDTGGFFVAAIRKVSDRIKSTAKDEIVDTIDQEAEVEAEALAMDETSKCNNEESTNDVNNESNRKKSNNERSNKPLMKGLSDFKQLDKEIYQKIKSTYKLSDDFDENSLYIREESVSANTKGPKVVPSDNQQFKTVYYLTLPLRQILQADREQRLKVVTAGSKNDVIDQTKLFNISTISSTELSFHAICWKGNSRSVNVMCGKVEIEIMKHKLEALGLLRPKISAPKREITTVPVILSVSSDHDQSIDETTGNVDSAEILE
eukprot:gene18020-23661_t